MSYEDALDGLSREEYLRVLPHRMSFLRAHGVSTVARLEAELRELEPYAPRGSDTPVTDALDAQGPIRAGTEGWWPLWGAQLDDVRPGDLIMTKGNGDKEASEYAVKHVFAKRPGHLGDIIELRILTHNDGARRIGRLCPVVILRRGTHYMLSDLCR